MPAPTATTSRPLSRAGGVDEPNQVYRLLAASNAIDAGAALDPVTLPDHDVVLQYLEHLATEPRPLDALLDIGAYEYCSLASCWPIFQDGFESGDTTAW